MQQLLLKPLPKMPAEIEAAIDRQIITLTDLSRMNELLCKEELQHDAGYRAYGNGNWQVSMYCPMPQLTPEMIQWWFWWHPQESLRYQIWYPGAHKKVGYAKKNAAYFQAAALPSFQANTQYPKEIIGGKSVPLRIDFVTPADFGFSEKLMEQHHVPLIVCGHVGIRGLLKHTEMAHIFKQTENGIFMFSRFWMGALMKSKTIKRAAIQESLARGMAEHCCIEYRNLAEILPRLYETYGPNSFELP